METQFNKLKATDFFFGKNNAFNILYALSNNLCSRLKNCVDVANAYNGFSTRYGANDAQLNLGNSLQSDIKIICNELTKLGFEDKSFISKCVNFFEKAYGEEGKQYIEFLETVLEEGPVNLRYDYIPAIKYHFKSVGNFYSINSFFWKKDRRKEMQDYFNNNFKKKKDVNECLKSINEKIKLL